MQKEVVRVRIEESSLRLKREALVNWIGQVEIRKGMGINTEEMKQEEMKKGEMENWGIVGEQTLSHLLALLLNFSESQLTLIKHKISANFLQTQDHS